MSITKLMQVEVTDDDWVVFVIILIVVLNILEWIENWRRNG